MTSPVIPSPETRRLFVRAAAFLSFLALPMALIALQQEPTAPEIPPSWQTLTTARPDGRQISVEGLVLERDAFELRLESGSLFLLPEILGRTPGAVFLGQGSWQLQPASAAEGNHLALRTGDPDLAVLSDRFESALLWFADGTLEALPSELATTVASVPEEAMAVLERWRHRKRERLTSGLELSILRALLNDEGRSGGPFFALIDGKTLERALLAVDPAGILDDEDVALIVDDDKNGGYWYSSHRISELESGNAAYGHDNRPVDAEHYAIHSRIIEGTELEATTSLRFTTLAPQLRLLPFALAPTLRIRSAELIQGDDRTPLQVIQVGAGDDVFDDSAAAVVSPEPLSRGTSAILEITYAGRDVLSDEGVGIYAVRARTDWYPKVGGFQDRATYDLTFLSPRGTTVISVGRKISEERQQNQVETKWQADKPITVAGFNYGDFKRFDQHEPNTDSDIEVWASTGTPDIIKEINMILEDATTLSNDDALAVAANDGLVYLGPSGPSNVGVSPDALAESALADGINTLQLMTALFGPLEYDRLALTQQAQWSFGQAWPTLIYLPYLTAMSQTMGQTLGMPDYGGFAEEVGYHEISHQWWGHKIGWHNYRDQWLSEGFAEFSTALMVERLEGQQAYDEFWEQRRRDIVMVRPGSELAAFQAGGVTMGYRAATPRAPRAYSALSYSKGAYVLHMLRMVMRDNAQPSPDARFFAMIRDFADTYSGGSPSTADFRRIVEKHMVPELDFTRNGSAKWFFDQWIHGTEVPRYEVDMAIEKAGGKKFRIHGTIGQRDVSDDFVALVPVYVDLGKGRYGQFGRAPFKGDMNQTIDVTLELPKKPKGVLVNALHDVLARE